jgi:UDP-glucose 4-epimerase
VPIITQTAVGKNSLTVFGNDFDTRDGSCIRDYIHVSDIADAHVKALNYLINGENKKNSSLFNLGTGNGITVLEAIRTFEEVTGRPLAYSMSARRPGDVMAIYANNEKAVQQMGWSIRYNLQEMMRTAWKWELAIKETEEKVKNN